VTTSEQITPVPRA